MVSRILVYLSLPPGGKGTTKWWKENACLYIQLNFQSTNFPSVTSGNGESLFYRSYFAFLIRIRHTAPVRSISTTDRAAAMG